MFVHLCFFANDSIKKSSLGLRFLLIFHSQRKPQTGKSKQRQQLQQQQHQQQLQPRRR